jgi:hypothetical protein
MSRVCTIALGVAVAAWLTAAEGAQPEDDVVAAAPLPGTTGAEPQNEGEIAPLPGQPGARAPGTLRPSPEASTPRRRDTTSGKTPDAATPEEPGTAAGHIDESTGPTSGARERPPEDEEGRTSPDRRDVKSVDPGISAPPEGIR